MNITMTVGNQGTVVTRLSSSYNPKLVFKRGEDYDHLSSDVLISFLEGFENVYKNFPPSMVMKYASTHLRLVMSKPRHTVQFKLYFMNECLIHKGGEAARKELKILIDMTSTDILDELDKLVSRRKERE